MTRALFVVVVAVTGGLVSGCGGELADCEQLAKDQENCMPDSAVDSCEEANAECKDAGEVLVLEGCPLQFTCDPG